MPVLEQLGKGLQTPADTLFSVQGNARKWTAALAARSVSNPAKLVFSGDSLTEGAQPLTGITFVEKVRRSLAIYNGDRTGPGWINAAPDASLITNGVLASAIVHPYKFRLTTGTYNSGGANIVQVDKGLAGYAFLLGVGSVLTLSDGANANTTAIFDTAEFHFSAKQAAGLAQLEIRIDGVLVQTVETQNGAITGTYESGWTYTWTGTRGPHTITVTAATNAAVFDGVYLSDGETVWAYNAGNAGDTYADVFTATNPGRFQTVKRIDADALLFLSGTNDWNTGSIADAATLGTNMATAIANVRTVVPDLTLGIVIPHPSGTRTAWATTFVPVMRSVAAAQNIPVCDISWIITSSSDPQGVLVGDAIHLSAVGAEAYAILLERFITGSAIDWVDQLSSIATRLLGDSGYKAFFDGAATPGATVDAYGSIVGYFAGRHADGTYFAPTATATSRVVSRLSSNAYGDAGARTNNGNPNAALDLITSAAATASAAPTDFRIMLPGTGVTPAERARFLSGGGLQWSEFAFPAGVANKIIQGARLSGSAHQLGAVMPDSTVRVLASSDLTDADVNPEQGLRPAGALAETVPRHISNLSAQTPLTTQIMLMQAIALRAGMTVTSISWMSGGTGAGTPTNWWFALYDASRNLLGQTADQTTTAWALQTVKTLALTSAYAVTTSGLYYVAIMVKATTVPSLHGTATNSNLMGITPILGGTSTGTLTTTAPNPAAAITASAFRIWAYVS